VQVCDGAAAAIKIDPFPFERPPRHDSVMGMFGDAPWLTR
jgi:hypothetical protein